MTSLRIEHADFAITVDADRRVLRDANIEVTDGVITAVDQVAGSTAGFDRTIDARGKLVTPGFSNGHLHISYAHAVRGIFPDDVDNRLAHVFAMQRAMNPDEEYAVTLLGIAEAVLTGTTMFVDPGTTQFPEACEDAYAASGVRVITGDHVIDRENPVNLPVYTTSDAIDRMERSLARLHGRLDGRMNAWTMPFSLDVCTPELLVAAKRIADEAGTAMTLHHSGGAASGDPTPTQRLADLDILGPNLVLSHCMNLTDEEIALVADSNTAVVMCPSTVTKSAGGIGTGGRLPELLEAGVRVALGTDSVNSSNFTDLVRSMQLAATAYKDARGDVGLIPPTTAIELATRTGAAALGAADRLGAIEVGRQADLVLFDVRRPGWQGLTDPVRNLVHSATGDSVDTVIIDGRVVVEGGEATFIDDMDGLIDRVAEAGTRIRSATGIDFPPSWPIT